MAGGMHVVHTAVSAPLLRSTMLHALCAGITAAKIAVAPEHQRAAVADLPAPCRRRAARIARASRLC